MYTTTSSASKEVVIEYAACEKGLETHGMIWNDRKETVKKSKIITTTCHAITSSELAV